MSQECRNYCLKAIDLAEKLIDLADETHDDCDCDACLVLFGIILDSASVIRREAEKRLNILESETATTCGVRIDRTPTAPLPPAEPKPT